MTKLDDIESKRVHRAHWDFTQFFEKADQMDDPHAYLVAVFYYEYFRTSNKLVEAVSHYTYVSNIPLRVFKQMRQLDNGTLLCNMDDENSDDFMQQREPYDIDEEQMDKDWDRYKKNRFHNVLNMLCRYREFPDVPAIEVNAFITGASFVFIPRKDNALGLMEKPAFWHLEEDKSQEGITSPIPIKWQDEVHKDKGRKHLIACINWDYTNDEITEVLTRYLKGNRPETHKNPIPLEKKDAGSMEYPFTHDPQYALECLGIFRKKSTCTWPEFLQLYHADNSDVYERTLIRKYNVAKKILHWMMEEIEG